MKKIILIISGLCLLSSCGNGFFQIRLKPNSAKGYGVIIYDFPAVRRDTRQVISSERDNSLYVSSRYGSRLNGGFIGYGKGKLPDEIIVRYQNFNLIGCGKDQEKVISNKYILKQGCVLEPIGEIYTKTVDLKPYQNHKVLKSVRSSFGLFSKYRGIITFDFYDDGEIKISLSGRELSNFKN